MRRVPLFGQGLGPLAALALFLQPLLVWADPPKPEKITFETFDKVVLEGTFYPSTIEGTKSRCVMLLHRIGGNRAEEGWEGLAKQLQDKGFAVLSFDFRGHGDSTSVKPLFWQVPKNQAGIRNFKPGKDSISHKDFTASYYPMLVNDIEAAKYTLEQKNNGKDCNANHIIVIGAEEGATLGLMWIASEAQHRRQNLTPQAIMVPNPETEWKDIDAGVFLSMHRTIEKTSMPISTWVNAVPKFREKMPVCFFYGKDDAESEKVAKYVYDDLLHVKETKESLSYKIPIAGTKLAGNKLLGSADLKTDELILKYLEKVTDRKAIQVWSDRDRDLKLNPLGMVPLNSLGIN
jgi:pimeloyl-ACP methyl ester carboxylesterase